jgi:hypothetical protein
MRIFLLILLLAASNAHAQGLWKYLTSFWQKPLAHLSDDEILKVEKVLASPLIESCKLQTSGGIGQANKFSVTRYEDATVGNQPDIALFKAQVDQRAARIKARKIALYGSLGGSSLLTSSIGIGLGWYFRQDLLKASHTIWSFISDKQNVPWLLAGTAFFATAVCGGVITKLELDLKEKQQEHEVLKNRFDKLSRKNQELQLKINVEKLKNENLHESYQKLDYIDTNKAQKQEIKGFKALLYNAKK